MAWAVALAGTQTARAQVSPKPLPPFVVVDLHEIQRLNLSPLALTLWSYLAAESRVTEAQGFGLSAAPHFGGAKIARLDRLLVWSAAGAAIGTLGASAPTLQTLRLPPQPVVTMVAGAVGGLVAGELVWQWLRPDLPAHRSRRLVMTFELTAVAVRLERLSTPIALPQVTYAWVPAIMGKW